MKSGPKATNAVQECEVNIEAFLAKRNWKAGNVRPLFDLIEENFQRLPDRPFKETDADRLESRAAIAVIRLFSAEPTEHPQRPGMLSFAYWAKSLEDAIALLRRLEVSNELIATTLRSAVQTEFVHKPTLLLRAQISLGKAFSSANILDGKEITPEESMLFLVKTAVAISEAKLEMSDPRLILVKKAEEYLGVRNPHDFYNAEELGEDTADFLTGGLQ